MVSKEAAAVASNRRKPHLEDPKPSLWVVVEAHSVGDHHRAIQDEHENEHVPLLLP